MIQSYEYSSMAAELQPIRAILDTVIFWVRANADPKPVWFESDTRLFESGVMEMGQYIELIDFLETRYEIRFDERDLCTANFSTIERIALVTSRYYLARFESIEARTV